MANPADPFGLSKRDPERDAPTGLPVPNQGGLPQTPLGPSANSNPFAIPPVAADPGGRPADGPIGGPTTPQPAPQPPTAGEPPKAPETPSGVTINIGGGQGKPEQPPSDASGQPPPGAPLPAPGPFGGLPAPVSLNRLPTATELQFTPPGTVVETPLGTIERDPGGTYQMRLSEAGVLKYKEAKVKEVRRFGSHPFAGDPNAPLPPVEPGQLWFNPFTGTWSRE